VAVPSRPRRLALTLLAAACAAGLCARAYRPHAGLTRLIGFSAAWHDRELPAVQAVPHVDDPGGGYDGRFYAQLAVDPLVRDPAIERALDTPVLRAHRILLSWTAWALGVGRPGWILEVYALQNVAAWIALAWLLQRWIPIVSIRAFALWAGTLASYGVLASVMNGLVDLPSALLVAIAIVLVEQERRLAAAIVAGLAGLARETSLMVGVAFLAKGWRAERRTAIRDAVIAIAPLAAWYAYVLSTHHWRGVSGVGNVGMPFAGFVWKLQSIAAMVARSGVDARTVMTIAGLSGFIVQGAVALDACRRRVTRTPWALVAAACFAFALCMQIAPWDETPGAYLRIALPLAIGANVVLAQRSDPSWPLIVAANLGVLPGIGMLAW
jgi:hypothetical protein